LLCVDCGIWEAWCPGRSNEIIGNSFHDHWATMGQAFTMVFPDSANNWWSLVGNVFYNNLQSGVPTQSPGGSTGMTLTGLKSYNQTVTDNIIADSSHDAGVWIGESGGLGGVYTVERNIFSNFTEKGQCGRGEYSQAGASLCYRDMPMIATATIGSECSNHCLCCAHCCATSPSAKRWLSTGRLATMCRPHQCDLHSRCLRQRVRTSCSKEELLRHSVARLLSSRTGRTTADVYQLQHLHSAARPDCRGPAEAAP
jgi:hypothetical protein